eukprot:TRINITY_DN6289_c0_g1_i1.p1 TRINITY_DN6289_c0_g1~~TRINITY_DN6289_c0_g1_i1.p1  ORF type:complete len:709 (-),score=91.54 TRINITY_DN6289_c0_g1_i1:43-2169(-)
MLRAVTLRNNNGNRRTFVGLSQPPLPSTPHHATHSALLRLRQRLPRRQPLSHRNDAGSTPLVRRWALMNRANHNSNNNNSLTLQQNVASLQQALQRVQPYLARVGQAILSRALIHTAHSRNSLPALWSRFAQAQRRCFSTTVPKHAATSRTQSRRALWIKRSMAALAAFGAIAGGVILYFPSVRHAVFMAFDAAIRFNRSALTAMLIAYDYKYNVKGEGEERSQALREIHKRSAERLRICFEKQGGIYVKAGQHIYSLDYILPPEYCNAMTPLHDRTPYCPFENVERVFKEEMFAHPDALYSEFDRTPVAAASLAQVHRARLKDEARTEVAVKVQFPRVRERSEGDVETIAFLVEVMSYIFPDFKMKWLVKEFRSNLPKELDFTNEARNSERTAAAFTEEEGVYVPKIFWDKTTTRILTMEYIHGVKVDDLAGLQKIGVSPTKVAELLCAAFNKQILFTGFVHCDPHPGNLLITNHNNNPRLVLLDHGLYRELDDTFRMNYAKLWRAIFELNEAEIARYCSLIAGPKASFTLFTAMLTSRSWKSVTSRDENRTMTPEELKEEKRRLQRGAADSIFEITDILATVPSDLLLLLKTNDLLRSLLRLLGSSHIMYEMMPRDTIRAIRHDSLNLDKSWSNYIRTNTAYAVWNLKLHLFSLYMRSLRIYYSLTARLPSTAAVPSAPPPPAPPALPTPPASPGISTLVVAKPSA